VVPVANPADLTSDGKVDQADYVIFQKHARLGNLGIADLDRDGRLTLLDYLFFLKNRNSLLNK
jgi:hypothetical protein